MIIGDGSMEGTSGTTQDAVRVLAKSLFRELKRTGYGRSEIVSFASELLDLVTEEMKTSSSAEANQSAS